MGTEFLLGGCIQSSLEFKLRQMHGRLLGEVALGEDGCEHGCRDHPTSVPDAKSLYAHQFTSEYDALGGPWLRANSVDFSSNKGGIWLGGRVLTWHT